jgi:hypothetical protein
MDKNYNIFSDDPTRHDSMMFSSSTINAAKDSTQHSDFKIQSGSKQLKYFYFFKFQENQLKKGHALTPYELAISQLSHEDKIIQKNFKFLLSSCESLESFEFGIRNKNNAIDILGIVEQSIEKEKATKKYSQNNYDWSGSLILLSMRNRFQKNRNPH